MSISKLFIVPAFCAAVAIGTASTTLAATKHHRAKPVAGKTVTKPAPMSKTVAKPGALAKKGMQPTPRSSTKAAPKKKGDCSIEIGHILPRPRVVQGGQGGPTLGALPVAEQVERHAV
ncbi:MAG: hypothetical protein NTW87_01725, partial [Planctomycetota bacterium]|nr:hypothetical protein [Planctomycetota bacterium]